MTEAALLAAVGAHPDDDTPRLVYADWLEEAGRAEQAEFTRVQCRLEAGGPADPDYPDLLLREEELKLWLGTFAPGPHLRGGLRVDGGREWWTRSRRGFPRYVEVFTTDWRGAAAARRAGLALEQLFARLPTRWLVVGDPTPAQLADLLRQPVAERLERLSVWASPANEEAADELARVIATAQPVRTLRGLFLGFPVGEAGAEALARAALDRLEVLSAEPDRLTAAEVRTLGRAGWFTRLVELSLENDLAEEAFVALCRAGPFPHLSRLALHRVGYGVAAWEAFARSRAFPAVARLDLPGADLSRGRMAALAAAVDFAPRHLNLWQCGIGNDGAAALARAAWAGVVQVLDLRNNRLSSAGARTLAAAPLASLRHLSLSQNALGRGLRRVLKAPFARNLTALAVDDLPNVAITNPDGAAALAALDAPNLRHMSMTALPLGPAGGRLLATDPRFARLTRLRAGSCGLGDEGAAALVGSPQLQELVELDLSSNGITTGAKPLATRAVMPRLASCGLGLNPLAPELAKKLRRRPGIEV